MEVPSELAEQMKTVQGTLDALDDFLQPFLDVTPRELDSMLSPLERARAHLALAQSVCLLYSMHLQLHGQRPEEHPVHKDQERLAAYDRKLRKVAARRELALSRPTASLDVAAANRFINAAIPELSSQQKQQLKQLGAAADERRRQAGGKGGRSTAAAGDGVSPVGKKPRDAGNQRRPAGAAQTSVVDEAEDVLAQALAGPEEDAATAGGSSSSMVESGDDAGATGAEASPPQSHPPLRTHPHQRPRPRVQRPRV